MIRLQTPDVMTHLKSSQLPTGNYLRELHVLEIADGQMDSTGDSRIDAVMMAATGGEPQVSNDPRYLPTSVAAMAAVPVSRDGEVTAVIGMVVKDKLADGTPTAGVFEVWKPVPPHEELALAHGSYGLMERFAGVSRFVRFEKGNGLPGQVWDQNLPVVHDDLSHHPGFLRAAGASADILQTAIGLPIQAGGEFYAAMLMISSTTSPLARGFEVWRADDEGYGLVTSAYHGLGESYCLADQARATEGSLADLVALRGTAVLTEEPEQLMAGRDVAAASPGPTAALAIPFYDGDVLRSVATLLF